MDSIEGAADWRPDDGRSCRRLGRVDGGYDDQSLVIVDLYYEQLKQGHLYVNSSRLAEAEPSIAKRAPGRS